MTFETMAALSEIGEVGHRIGHHGGSYQLGRIAQHTENREAAGRPAIERGGSGRGPPCLVRMPDGGHHIAHIEFAPPTVERLLICPAVPG